MVRQSPVDILAVRGCLHRCSAFAAGEQRLLAHDGSGDDRASHAVAVLEADRARRADLGARAAADAQLGGPREVEVGEPAGRRGGHAQSVDAHLAARDLAEAAADAKVAAQAAAGLVVSHRVGQALLDLDVVPLAENLLDAPLRHDATG